MVLVHNLLLRHINAVHRQTLNVVGRGTAKDKLDFANFAHQWGVALHAHHDLEETSIFPKIQEATGDDERMNQNLEEHRMFDAVLGNYMDYLKEVTAEKIELDGEKLVALIDEMMPIIHRHLVHEIDTLLALKEYDDKVEWMKLWNDIVGPSAAEEMKKSEYRVSLLLCPQHGLGSSSRGSRPFLLIG